MNRLWVVLVVGAVCFACSGPVPSTPLAPSTPEDDVGVGLSPSVIAQMEGLIAEKAARTPAQRKIASQLLYMRAGRFNTAQGQTKGEKLENLAQVDGAGRVLVDVKGDLNAGLQAQTASQGGTVVSTSARHGSMRAWVKLERMEELAANPGVQAVRPAFLATTNRHDAPGAKGKFQTGTQAERIAAVQTAVQRSLKAPLARGASSAAITSSGSVVSEGDSAHGANRARKYFNADGSGVRIGVLSDSDDLKEASIATGDLPPDTVTVPGQDGRPGAGEGTAMMEIVHDLAPGAKLFFASAFNSPESFAENIRTLRFVYHCDIIVDDVIYFFESPYEDDIIAQAVDDVIKDGAMYFSSAGNGGNAADGTSGTWEGDFKSAGTLSTLPSGYEVHDFGSRVISNRVEVGGGPLMLHWSDPGTLDLPASFNDYDLFVLDHDLRNVLVASTDIQDGTGLPFEFLGFNLPPNVRVVVARHPGAKTRAIRTVLFNGELGIATSGSTFGHNSAPNALAIAAVDVAEAVGGKFIAGPTTPVELYSSDGNRRVFYDRNNRPLGGGVTFASGGGELRRTPQLAAADGVATTLPASSGLNPFFGTSAAAPHAAAIAGLIQSAVPHITSSRIRHALIDGALDIEASGFDRNSGAGIVSAMVSMQLAGAHPAVFLDVGAVAVTPVGSDVLLPGGSGTLAVQVVNNGGATARNVRATLASSSPYVTVTQATSFYPDVAPGAAAFNVTPFAFSVSSAAPCGTKLAFSLTLTFSGVGTSPRGLAFLVPTGRPSATAKTFSYAGPVVPIPDGDSAGVDVPLAVSFAEPLSKLVFRVDGTACSSTAGATTVGIDHTWVGDLVFSLTSPAGTKVTLVNRAGGVLNSGNNFCQTVLDDAATASIQDVLVADAPFTGSFSPAKPLGTFAGEPAAGTWTFNVSDNVSFDSGNVRAFSMDVSGYSCTP